MKTKEQVLEHLMHVGYSKDAITKIMGFLIGNGTKTIDEKVVHVIGNKDFDYFINWYQEDAVNEPGNDCPVCNLFEHLFNAYDIASNIGNDKLNEELDEMMNLMLDIFITEADDDNK